MINIKLKFMKKTNILIILSLTFSIYGCSSTHNKNIGNALTSPLSDLNLVKNDIPNELINLNNENVTKINYDLNCENIFKEKNDLKNIIFVKNDDDKSLINKSENLINNYATNSISKITQDSIPFRGFIRKITGAEKYNKKYLEAFKNGENRFYFLNGVEYSLNCIK